MPAVVKVRTGQVIRMSEEVVGLERATGAMVLVPQQPGRPPVRIDGHTVGLAHVAGESPHGGEMHPDGDELLCMVSGRVTVRLELPGGHEEVGLGPGDALVVPRGVWHVISSVEPGLLFHVTPGPRGQARPRSAD